jgi:AraC-like DNA-binding protein
MLFRRYAPAKPLDAFIEDFWSYEDYGGDHAREHILPTGTVEMVFNLQEDELRIYGLADGKPCRCFSGAVVSGPYVSAFASDIEEETAILGVHFKPGGAWPVLGLPVDALHNTHVDLLSLWGSEATLVHDQLASLRDPMARFRLLERVLLERVVDPPRHHRAVSMGLDVLSRTHGRAGIAAIAKTLDVSQRRFSQVFAAQVGMTPKLFARVQRFQHVVAASGTARSPDWAQIALECGYFDQAHLINEFVEFSGVTPADFRHRRDRLASVGAHVKRHHLPRLS